MQSSKQKWCQEDHGKYPSHKPAATAELRGPSAEPPPAFQLTFDGVRTVPKIQTICGFCLLLEFPWHIEEGSA